MEKKMMSKKLAILLGVVIVIVIVLAVIFINSDKLIGTMNNTDPSAVINAPVSGKKFAESDEIMFNSQSSSDPDNDNLKFEWSSNISGVFGTKRMFVSTLPIGTHKITLTVTDGRGGKSTAELDLFVYPHPEAVIELPSGVETYYSTEFVVLDGGNSTSKYSSDLNYTWSSDRDGLLGFAKKLSAKLSVGYHEITLTVDDGLSESSKKINIEVKENQNPNAVIKSPKYDETFQLGSKINFDATGSWDPDGQGLFYNWTSNYDGLIGTQSNFNTNLSAGTHIITLEVNDGHGGFGNTLVIVNVNTPPVANAGEDRVVELGTEVKFDGAQSYDADGDELIFTWDFGDGSKDLGEKVTHTYFVVGSYQVNLTVDDNKKAEDIDTIQIEVIYVFQGTGVYGYVFDNRTGLPMAYIDVEVEGYEPKTDNYFWDFTYTDEYGFYEMQTTAGDFTVSISNDGYFHFEKDITITEDEGVELNIDLIPFPPETASIWGHVYAKDTNDPLFDAGIWIENEEDGYFNYSYTDFSGYYEMNAPPGTFMFECDYYDYENDISYQTFRTEITLTDNQDLKLDIYLELPIPTESNITLEFISWDLIKMTSTTIDYSDTTYMRQELDQDYDDQVTESEVTAFEQEMEFWYEEMFSDFNTSEILYLDNITYQYVSGTVNVEIDGAVGPTDSTEPITTTYSIDLNSENNIPTSNAHTFEINVDYDEPNYLIKFYIEFPTLFKMTNYTTTDNVEVCGCNNIDIDPKDDPDPEDEIYDEWVTIVVKRSV